MNNEKNALLGNHKALALLSIILPLAAFWSVISADT
jgi:hypothetical protein